MGKVIVITGAGIGLGRAVARRFGDEGETLVLLGRTLSKVQAVADELGSPAMALECDVANPDSVRAAFAEIAKVHPKIDVLINNAAVYEPFRIADGTDDQIMGMAMINYVGPILCCRSAIPMMEKGGHIINLSSESVGFEFPMMALYQSSKAGMERFSQTLERELEESGIRVTVLRAGPMWDDGKESGWSPEVGMAFHQACVANGIDLFKRPISQVNSVTTLFRTLIDLPPDVKVTHVSLGGRTA